MSNLEDLRDALVELIDAKEAEYEAEVTFLRGVESAIGVQEEATVSAVTTNLDELLGRFGLSTGVA